MAQDKGWGRFEVAAPDPEQRNIVWSSQGVGGSGKTHFGLTAPGPIAYFLFDPGGLKGLLEKPEFADKEVRLIDYSKKVNPGKLAQEDRGKAAIDCLSEFEEDWEVAIRKARTIIWDKEDHVWEMLRYANFEEFTDRPSNYYELNMKYRGWFAEAEGAGVNFGVMRGMKERWGQNAKGSPVSTGEFDPRGMKEVPELVQINLAHRWDDVARQFKVQILDKCRIGNAVELLGTEESGFDFTTMALKLYPESTFEEWGL